jgi:hypothetical protein
VDKLALGQVYLRVFGFCPVVMYHSTIVPELSFSVCCCYQKDKRAKPGNLPNAMLFRTSGSVNEQVLCILVFKGISQRQQNKYGTANRKCSSPLLICVP